MDFRQTEPALRNPSKSPQEKSQGHECLDAFVGHWAVQGKNPLASVEAGTDITGVETYEWLAGEHFLEYRWDRVLAYGWHHGVGMIGYDVESESHFAHFYDNLGFTRHYLVTVEPRHLQFKGQFERGGLTLAPDSHTMKIHWERSTDGDHWKTLCDLVGTRTA